ncbi:MAG: DUF2934 domain-containing protein [Acidobacteriota bacterium]|nr:DUF2934 domain-containing protein [Acidobacteriota bacterium]
MPKAPRATDASSAPKKRSRKANSENGNGLQAKQPKSKAPEIVVESPPPLSLEERIRVRAYELYLQRNGIGGSPEQDWLQALHEISAQQRSA